MTYKVLAVDPGNHCGLAWLLPDGKHDSVMYFERETDVFKTVALKPDVLVIETFSTAGNISKYGIYTIDLIGGIKALCWQLHIPIVYHPPYVRLPYIEDAKGVLNANRLNHRWVVHEMDAMAHCLAYEHRNKKGLDIPLHADARRALHGPAPSTSTGPGVHDTGVRRPSAVQSIRSKLRND